MKTHYQSFLICDHATIIAYYKEGLEVAIFHKDTQVFEIKTRHKEHLVSLEKMFSDSAKLIRDHNTEQFIPSCCNSSNAGFEPESGGA